MLGFNRKDWLIIALFTVPFAAYLVCVSIDRDRRMHYWHAVLQQDIDRIGQNWPRGDTCKQSN